MNSDSYKIFPLGDNALTIEFGNEISPALNDRAVEMARYFDVNPFPGMIETVPAYSSLTLFYDVYVVKKAFADPPTAFETVRRLAEDALRFRSGKQNSSPRLVQIPVDFSPEHALDLDLLSRTHNLSGRKIIEIFTAGTYRVFMLGFMPGFAYLGEIDARLATPRKQSPRLNVPKGSVGIAGRQTGIYPFDSPGGWQIIGKTDFELFTPEAENPCALAAGDLVEFYAVKK